MSFAALHNKNAWTEVRVTRDRHTGEIMVRVHVVWAKGSGTTAVGADRVAVLHPDDWHKLPAVIDLFAKEMLESDEVAAHQMLDGQPDDSNNKPSRASHRIGPGGSQIALGL